MQKIISFAVTLVLVTTATGLADDTASKPAKEHQFLKKFVGTWDCASDCSVGPGQEVMKTTAVSSNRMIGDFWVVNEIVSENSHAKVTAIQTIGFDEKKKKFVGTWVDSMFNHLWQYEGSLNESGTTLTLEAEGPNFMTGEGTAMFRDVYEFTSDDRIVATSSARGEDGKWVVFVKGVSEKKPANDRPKSE